MRSMARGSRTSMYRWRRTRRLRSAQRCNCGWMRSTCSIIRASDSRRAAILPRASGRYRLRGSRLATLGLHGNYNSPGRFCSNGLARWASRAAGPRGAPFSFKYECVGMVGKMSDIVLRRYERTDLGAIVELDAECFDPPFRFSREAMRRFAEAANAWVVIAEVE